MDDVADGSGAWLTPVRIALIYVVVGGLWIALSDQAVAALPVDRALVTQLQTVKGWLFVGASALLIYGLVARYHRQLTETNRSLARALEQASVLHRLLRHNLRNACTVIQLEAERLAESDEDGVDPRATRTIERQVETLLELGEKSRHLRQIALGEQARTTLDLVAIVEETVEGFRAAEPAADLTVETPDAAWVRGYPELEVVVRELLENAVEHGAGQGEQPARSPETAGDWAPEHHQDDDAGADQGDESVVAIDVTVERRDDVVVLRVSDDGPGVPAMERAVLERGMEEPLSHSQGLGLWVVRAIVGDSGGDLTVRDADAGGTTVEIELEAATPPERAASHRQTV